MKSLALLWAMIVSLASPLLADEATTPATIVNPTTVENSPPPEVKPVPEEAVPAELAPAKKSKPADPAQSESPENKALDAAALADPDVAARINTEYPVDGDEWHEYPLGVLEMEMQEVIEDLSSGKPKPPALVTQPRIISRLDMMIVELEKKCNGGGGSNNAGNRPAEKSVLRKGKMKDGEMRAVKNEGDRWANLPAKEREKILQSQNEGFPAGYEDVLADYFRKLSRSEKPAATSKEAETPPASAPDGTK